MCHVISCHLGEEGEIFCCPHSHSMTQCILYTSGQPNYLIMLRIKRNNKFQVLGQNHHAIIEGTSRMISK